MSKFLPLATIMPLFAATWIVGVIAQAASSPTIEGVLVEAAKQIPALCALIWIVYQFLSHLRAKDAEALKRDSERDAALKTLGDNCHDFQREMAAANGQAFIKVATALDRNAELMGRTLEMTLRMDRSIQRMDDLMNAEKDRT